VTKIAAALAKNTGQSRSMIRSLDKPVLSLPLNKKVKKSSVLEQKERSRCTSTIPIVKK
jgi:hypothetical protein